MSSHFRLAAIHTPYTIVVVDELLNRCLQFRQLDVVLSDSDDSCCKEFSCAWSPAISSASADRSSTVAIRDETRFSFRVFSRTTARLIPAISSLSEMSKGRTVPRISLDKPIYRVFNRMPTTTSRAKSIPLSSFLIIRFLK